MRTVRQIYKSVLVELSKTNSPSLLLEEFNYFLNKAINQCSNKYYNRYDVNQLSTDDLLALKSSATLIPKKMNSDHIPESAGVSYTVELPDDYRHILNCTCVYRLDRPYKCLLKDSYVSYTAKRLTADSWSVIINDYYNSPRPEYPYYYIYKGVPLEEEEKKDLSTSLPVTNLSRTIQLLSQDPSQTAPLVTPKNMCEIRYGDDNIYKLVKVYIDYIRNPKFVQLNPEDLILIEDKTPTLEFPDYICQEIINELVILVMHRDADPRLLSLPEVLTSIANPAQQLVK